MIQEFFWDWSLKGVLTWLISSDFIDFCSWWKECVWYLICFHKIIGTFVHASTFKIPIMTLLTFQGSEGHVLVLDVARKGLCTLAFKSYLNWKRLPLYIHGTWELSFIFLNLIAQYKKFDCLLSFKKFIDKNHVSFLILFWIYVLLLLFSNLIF